MPARLCLAHIEKLPIVSGGPTDPCTNRTFGFIFSRVLLVILADVEDLAFQSLHSFFMGSASSSHAAMPAAPMPVAERHAECPLSFKPLYKGPVAPRREEAMFRVS